MVLNVMNHRRNRRPAGTALAAKESFPISDRRARLVAFVQCDQSCSSVRISLSLVSGSRICCWTESSSRPRKVSELADPSTLFGDRNAEASAHFQELVKVGGTR